MTLHRRHIVTGALAGAAALLGGRTQALAAVKPDRKAALLVVDVQNCFLPGGTLPVKEGNEVIPVINRLAAVFDNIVVTQDWHTPGHASFASTHAGKKPFETTELGYGTQVLWPDHCVQGTSDAELGPGLKLPTAQLMIRKGYHKDTDSYSAFIEADKKTRTGLDGYLKSRGIDTRLCDRAGDRLLRRLDRDGCPRARLRCLRGRGCDPRHRPRRLAGEGLEGHGSQGSQADPFKRHRRLT